MMDTRDFHHQVILSGTSTAQNSNAPSRANSPDSYRYAENSSRSQQAASTECGFELNELDKHPIISKQTDELEKGSQNDKNAHRKNKLPLRERLKHFTWAWFTLPMSCGGISLLIYAQPYKFPALLTIGTIIYSINVIIFTSVVATMISRFIIHPGTLLQSLTHPREGFFFPTFFLAIATLITSTQRYAVPKNDPNTEGATKAIFWIYLIFTFTLAVTQYTYLFGGHTFKLQTMMPSWILPIFPIMLTGTIASVIIDATNRINPITIIAAGLTCQGLGFSVSLMMYAHMVGRLMESGLPNREHRPALFMCVGPPAFTALALIGMANEIPENLSNMDTLSAHVGTIRTIAVLCGIFLLTLSLWWFLIAALSIAMSPPKYFHLGCWAMVFPNTGFTLATISVGQQLKDDGILAVATGMSILVFITFIFVLAWHIRAVIIQDILYPGRDEDVEDH